MSGFLRHGQLLDLGFARSLLVQFRETRLDEADFGLDGFFAAVSIAVMGLNFCETG